MSATATRQFEPLRTSHAREATMDRPRHLRAVAGTESAPSLEQSLHAAGTGDQEAFTHVYTSLLATVVRVALRVVRDPELAEDVAQEALVEAWRQAPTYDPGRGSAKAWVLTITHRRAVDRVRREQRQRQQMDAEALEAAHAPPETPQDEIDEQDHRQWQSARVRHALDDLSPAQREAIELAYYGGRTQAQISEHLGIPLGTAKTRIRDAMKRLRTSLEEVET